MLSAEDIMKLIQSLIWLLAGVGVFIVGMNFMSDALEKSTGEGMKKMLGRISNNRFSGMGIGAGVTAIIQSSSATSVMVIGLVNAFCGADAGHAYYYGREPLYDYHRHPGRAEERLF